MGYYYNNLRDTADWYKVTTTADGLLRIYLSTERGSIYSNNSLDVNVGLYDNDGVTQLSSVETFNGNGPASGLVSTDGLAPGTYYIRVQPFSTDQFANYTISDTLFISPIANDAEPNGTRATALVFPENSSKTGHIGYYYNNLRDTADWYKITTTADGLLRVYLNTSRGSVYSSNALDVNITLYDNDGITQLGSDETFNSNGPASGFMSTDRLAAGTYYVKVQPFSTTQFANYELTDSLFTYNLSYKELNDHPYQAITITADKIFTGHIGFYYNDGHSDMTDWYKINYTGSGNLQFNFTLLPHLSDGLFGDGFFKVYKDTAGMPIFNRQFYTASTDFTLNALEKGTYWIKITPFNSDPAYFAAYAFSILSPQISWTGTASTSWTDGANWSTAMVPSIIDDVTIQADTHFSPIIASGVTGFCHSIKVNSGATMIIATGGKLTIGH